MRALPLAGVLLPAPCAGAVTHALIVRGLSADAVLEQDWDAQQAAWEGWIAARAGGGDDKAPARVEVLAPTGPDDRTVRARFVAALDRWAVDLKPDDDAYVVLLGHGSTRGSRYRFDVRGPRIIGDDLTAPLTRVRAARVVVAAPGPGGAGLATALNAPHTVVLSATDHGRQINHPRFGAFLAELLVNCPDATLGDLAAQADRRVADYYKQRKLVRTETAGWWAAGEREAFAAAAPVAAVTTPVVAEKAGPAPFSSDLPDPGPDARYRVHAHTEADRAALAAAPPAATHGAALATVLSRDIVMDLKPDGSALWTESARVVIHDLRARDLIDNVWTSKCTASGCSPVRLKSLRVVRPDGFTLAWDYQAPPPPFLPGVIPGTLVAYDFETIANKPLIPRYSGSIALALYQAEILAQSVSVSHELATPIATRLVHADGTAKATAGDSFRRERFTQTHVAPAGDGAAPRIALTGFQGWGQVADFYRGMMRDTVGDAAVVAATARAWTAGADGRFDKIAALYERANTLRYVAIPLGVKGLRPEPVSEVLQNGFGDCKAKANLLVKMMDTLGIEAHFVLINRGAPPGQKLDPSFPAWDFNHAVVVVPDPTGDGAGPPLWMDATDGFAPLGMMPPGDPGQNALVLADEPYVAEVPAFFAASDGGLSPGSQPEAAALGPRSTVGGVLNVNDEGIAGPLMWRLEGVQAYRWMQVLQAGDDVFRKAFTAATRVAWPDAVLNELRFETGKSSSQITVFADVRFENRITALPGNQMLVTPPASWFAAAPPLPGYPVNTEQKLGIGVPEGWAGLSEDPARLSSADAGWSVRDAPPSAGETSWQRIARVAAPTETEPPAPDARAAARRAFRAAAQTPRLFKIHPPVPTSQHP